MPEATTPRATPDAPAATRLDGDGGRGIDAPERSDAGAPALDARRRPLVAIAGNPNVGKTTIFNRLTGADLRVGNYPGVTVEVFSGHLRLDGRDLEVLDVPGSYSLSARTGDEQVAMMAIAGLPPLRAPDLAVVVVDATQLTRNLYLALQVVETGVPVVIALNMTDVIAARGETVDVAELSSELGVPVVAVSGLRGTGIDELKSAIAAVLDDPASARPGWRWRPVAEDLCADVAAVAEVLPPEWVNGRADRRDALALWALLSVDDQDELDHVPDALRRAVRERREQADLAGRDIDMEVVRGRYAWIDERAPRFHVPHPGRRASVTDRVDDFLLNPVVGFAVFLVLMGALFQALFSWADPLMGLVEELFGRAGMLAAAVLPDGLLEDFVVDGLIAGVGSVLVFLPQILLLFLFLGILEDTGYMARVAFLMDRVMKAVGLHGRAFVPMLSGYACAIPAIMATRTMERRRDRMLTMMVVPLMSCAARLPVYLLIIGALFPPTEIWGLLPVQGLLMVAMYFFSTVVALVAAAVLGRTVFKGPRVPLILELPPYRRPHWRSVLRLMWHKGALFVKEAGTVILVCTIGLWFLLTFPREPRLDTDFGAQRVELEAADLAPEARAEALARVDSAEQGARLRASWGGRLGGAIEPAIEPLGFDWKIGIGLVGAFAAREVFVSTMGVVYGIGGEVDQDSATLREQIRAETRADGKPVYTPLTGLSLMIFFALACQCMSTLAVVRRETRTWRWPLFLFGYMTALAWVASFVVYQGGKLLGF